MVPNAFLVMYLFKIQHPRPHPPNRPLAPQPSQAAPGSLLILTQRCALVVGVLGPAAAPTADCTLSVVVLADVLHLWAPAEPVDAEAAPLGATSETGARGATATVRLACLPAAAWGRRGIGAGAISPGLGAAAAGGGSWGGMGSSRGGSGARQLLRDVAVACADAAAAARVTQALQRAVGRAERYRSVFFGCSSGDAAAMAAVTVAAQHVALEE